MNPQNPIGIFDSGIGGLTVYRAIRKILPLEDLIYLGDTARVPYGTKSEATVQRYARQNVEWLIQHDVKMVVVACNTASAFALNALQAEFSIPIVGVIKPGVKAAIQKTKRERIGVIGTAGTVHSEAYTQEIKKMLPNAYIVSRACPLFVPLVEEGRLSGRITDDIAKEYLSPFRKERIDTLILGCTHYPLLKPAIRKMMSAVTLIDSAEATAKETLRLLKEKRMLGSMVQKGESRIYVTDLPNGFKKVAQIFLKNSIPEVAIAEI